MTARAAVAVALLLLTRACSAVAVDDTGCTPPRRLQRIDGDDLAAGLVRWRIEAEHPATTVHAEGGVLDMQTPAGLSVWWREALHGDWVVRFTAVALPAPASAGSLAGRVSDLNMFWNATEPDGSAPRRRSGAFAANDDLRAYYVGFGANGNRTTRLRHYDGSGQRRLLAGWADHGEAEPGDREGPMTDTTRLAPGRTFAVQVVSRRPTAEDPVHLRWSVNGRTLFTRADAAPLLRGWFALRTTASRLQLRDFQVLQCVDPDAAAIKGAR